MQRLVRPVLGRFGHGSPFPNPLSAALLNESHSFSTDNGAKFRGKPLDVWAKMNEVELHCIDPGKHTQNGHIESFNGRFREECLNQEWFVSLKEARLIIEKWRLDYNSVRPHSSLGYLPPDVWTQKLQILSR